MNGDKTIACIAFQVGLSYISHALQNSLLKENPRELGSRRLSLSPCVLAVESEEILDY